jgi:hypothetical protein
VRRRRGLAGERFGRLTVAEEAEPGRDRQGKPLRRWQCQCDCGAETVVFQSNLLKRQGTTSCGCLNRERTAGSDLSGVRFGRCVALRPIDAPNHQAGRRGTRWLCECECGRRLIAHRQDLLRLSVQTCGCRVGRTRRVKAGDQAKMFRVRWWARRWAVVARLSARSGMPWSWYAGHNLAPAPVAPKGAAPLVARRRAVDPPARWQPDPWLPDAWAAAWVEHPMCYDWAADFRQFAAAVGQPPTKRHRLRRPDATRPMGPGNVEWAVRKPGEGDGYRMLLSLDAPRGRNWRQASLSSLTADRRSKSPLDILIEREEAAAKGQG